MPKRVVGSLGMTTDYSYIPGILRLKSELEVSARLSSLGICFLLFAFGLFVL